MKNVCVLLVLSFICLSPKINAQFQYGIKTGLHIGYAFRLLQTSRSNGSIIYDRKKDERNWPSPILGVYATFKISRLFSLQTELIGLHRTWRSDLGIFSRSEQFEYTYLNLPFMIHLRDKSFGFELGPAFSYQLFRRNISTSQTIPMEPQRVELALNAGFNYYFRRWSAGIRFTNDITPFFRNNHRASLNSSTRTAYYYHRGYQMSIAHQL